LRYLICVIPLGLLIACGTGQTEAINPSSTPDVVVVETDVPHEAGDMITRAADGMVTIFVPAGSFTMGTAADFPGVYENELPQHEVTVDAFWIDQNEVTNRMYALCVQARACKSPEHANSYDRTHYYGVEEFLDFPVVFVNWYQAQGYCNWVGGRLPTEAEWAFAARGPESYMYPWGENFDQQNLNYCDANCPKPYNDIDYDDGYLDTAPVGNYPGGASWVGALDMLGNVWEWMQDWHGYYEGHRWLERPIALTPPVAKTIRGGGWDTVAGHSRAAFRNWFVPEDAWDSIGFRCVMDSR
jgi:serine/threonine-protein kinase